MERDEAEGELGRMVEGEKANKVVCLSGFQLGEDSWGLGRH